MKILITLLLLLIAPMSYSQFSIGVAAGGNFSNFPGDDDLILSRGSNLNLTDLIGGGNATLSTVDNKSRINFNFGVKAEYGFSDQWALESGLYYSPQGDRIEGEATIVLLGEDRPVEYIAITKLEYILLPLKAKYDFSEKFSALFGPQMGYKLGGSVGSTEGYFPVTDDTLEFEEDIDDRLNDFDFGGIGGIEYRINHNFGINAEHFLAATQLPKEDRKVHNSVTSLKLFFYF